MAVQRVTQCGIFSIHEADAAVWIAVATTNVRSRGARDMVTRPVSKTKRRVEVVWI